MAEVSVLKEKIRTVLPDIRELKLTKISMDNGRQRYSVMQGQDSHSDKYIRILQDGYLSMDRAMNILVLRTVPVPTEQFGAI